MWQPGVIQDKLRKNHSYPGATNYWAPLTDKSNDEKEENKEEINMLQSTATKTDKIK
jgi:hypothetical protein